MAIFSFGYKTGGFVELLRRLIYFCFFVTTVSSGKNLSDYVAIAEQLPRQYEETAISDLTATRLEPLWERLEASPILSVYRSGLPKVEVSSVIGRLVKWAKKRESRAPRLRSYQYQTVLVEPGQSVLMLGYLGGSFHSLVHVLCDLVRKKILDQDLHLIDSGTVLVLGGDFSMPSPFWLYSLDLVATLLEQNKERCVIARGRTERFNLWQGFDTVRAYLKRITSKIHSPEVPFAKDLQLFFDSLPDVIRLQHAKTKESILISNHQIPHEVLAYPDICSWIASSPVASPGRVEDGFGFSRFCSGVAQWALFSAPDFVTSHYMSGYLILPIKETLAKQIGRYCFGDRKFFEKLFEEKRYALSYGFELRNEKDVQRLLDGRNEFVCSTADLSGGTGLVGESVSFGVEAVLRDTNQKGTCAPLLFRHVVFDDQYEPSKARKNVERIRTRYGATYLLAPQGSPTLTSYINLVKNKELAVLFSESGATQFRTPDIPYIVNLRPSFLREVNCLLEYVTNTYSLKRLAAVYQDDAFGNPLVDATQSFLNRHAAKVELIKIPYVRGQGSFAKENENLLESDAPAILYFITSSGPAQSLFGGEMTIFLKGRSVLLVLVDESILRVLERQGISAIFTSSVPDPYHSAITLVERYRDIFSREKRALSTHSLLGFISGTLFVDGVSRLIKSGTSVIGGTLVSLFEQYKDVNLEGMHFSFNQDIRSFSLPVWIHQKDGTWVQGSCL